LRNRDSSNSARGGAFGPVPCRRSYSGKSYSNDNAAAGNRRHYGDGITEKDQRPRGFVPIGAFFLFGATTAAYAAVTLLKPGTVLDRLWALNKAGHVQLATFGKSAGFGFVVLSALMCAAAVGWFRRRLWGWVLGTTIIAINAAGDLINGVLGEWLKGAVGVAIAGLLLIYMTRSFVRNYFRHG
jgi:hypothetical protein